METTYIDLHTHTTNSDGAYTPMQVCRMAREAGIGILSITDHNYTEDLTGLRSIFPQLQLIQGAEISCRYRTSGGKKTELHLIALGFDAAHPKIRRVLDHNQQNRQPYIDAIADRLRDYGIDIGCYTDLCRLYPGKRHIGRMDIARILVQRGDTATVTQAFDEYLGAHGQRKAYVPNTLEYVSLEEAVSAITEAGGIPVLAHLYYYLLSDEENEKLLSYFRELTGPRGAMEVDYSLYDEQQRQVLKTLADRYGLMYSAASDFHGQSQTEDLNNRFPASGCAPLLSVLGIKSPV